MAVVLPKIERILKVLISPEGIDDSTDEKLLNVRLGRYFI
jgi:hypothetical protein